MKRDYAQRVLFFGFLLFLFGLATGFAVGAVRNPRMGLAAHLEGVMNGLFLVGLGLAWPRIALSAPQQLALFALALYGAYANWLATLLAAIFGTSQMTPLSGAGFSGEPWQESLVNAGLITVSLAIVAAVVLVLWGLHKGRGVAAPST